MRVAAILVLLFAGQAGLAAEQTFKPDENGQISFRLPSGNIACTFAPSPETVERGPQLVCERVEPIYTTAILGRDGIPVVLPKTGEISCCYGPVLRYGNFWQAGPFTCTSERTGLTCRREDGRGFSIARAQIELF